MYSIIEIALINAVMIFPLALLAEGAGRFFRRPALTHLLWVLILIKLMTPPLWQIPLLDRGMLTQTVRYLLPPILADFDPVSKNRSADESNRISPRRNAEKGGDELIVVTKPKPRPRTLDEQDKLIAIRKNSPLVIVGNWVHNDDNQQLVSSALAAVWGLGAILWFSVQGFRCIRFRNALSRGTAAPPELQEFSNQFGRRLGLTRSPAVWLMPGVMSPMLWGNGHSTRLIFPEQLLDRLDQEATATLLTHELAHFRRRDHWVRVIALMATGFFWWHPIVWWARREIEAVEEECCDALVLKFVTSPPKRYAEAILETIDFLAEYRLRLPPLATGLSQFTYLRQRLTWIMRGPRKQDLGYLGLALLVLLTSSLPVQPTWLTAEVLEPIPNHRMPVRPQRIEFVPPPQLPSSDSDEEFSGAFAMAPSDTELESPVVPSKWQGFEVRSYSFDKRFVFMANDSTQILLDIQTGRDFDLTPFDIISIAFSPDTNQFATIDSDRFLRLWDAEICDFQTWQIPGGSARTVDLSYGARWIATGGTDGVVRIWSVASKRPIRELPREFSPVNCVRFSPEGDLLAVATGDLSVQQSGRIALFNVGAWSERISMNWNSPAAAVAFNVDGESLTSGDWQGRIARWSIATGELLGRLDGQKKLIAAAEFSPNGSPLLEIEIPDLDPNTSWGEPTSGRLFQSLFDRWPLTAPAGTTMPSSPAAPTMQDARVR